MKESELTKQSIELSVEIIEFYKWLVSDKKEFIMSKQILRSGTSIGANIHEAYFGSSKADFINKMQIALKESSETEYWIVILERTNYFDLKFSKLKELNLSLKRMLIATLNSAKENKNEHK